MPFTRRQLLAGSLGLTAWSEIAAAQQHAHTAVQAAIPPKLQSFDAESAAEIDAIVAQILPSGDGPGAREAGVIYFIDRALATFDADKKEAYQKGMAEFQEMRRKLFPASSSVVALSNDQQIELIRALEKSEFFEVLRTHTMLGFLGNPSYGGNRNQVGWRHIGFENRMAFEAPFGYYDAEARKGTLE
ncbi:MAG TPA: gluconate 2-dehydrogenase subunit 3 family protein [Bryobacteraceae bacterium]|nr:gluconate 2-dehydrogenase subunit 3 family protein [Bryobacteraceae bacterium]